MRVKTKHELSKSVEKMCFTVELPMVTEKKKISGGDALRGHTRSHPEHEG